MSERDSESTFKTSNERSLVERLFDAQVASCSCLTKTPAHEYHDPMCRYRLFYEAWRALSRQKSVTMNGFQARMVLKFIDGDDDCSLEVADLPERTASNGEHMAAGLYVWLSDYPEEGCLLLTEEPTVEGFCAEPKQVETSGDVRVQNLISALKAKQAKIDALMMEFCPGEMSEAQRAEWAAHQQPASVDVERDVASALKTRGDV